MVFRIKEQQYLRSTFFGMKQGNSKKGASIIFPAFTGIPNRALSPFPPQKRREKKDCAFSLFLRAVQKRGEGALPNNSPSAAGVAG